MSFTWIARGDLGMPVIVCDACQRPIDDGAGNVYWVMLPSGDTHPQVWHTHKSACAQLDRVLAQSLGGVVLSEELDRWLTQLSHNLHHPIPRTPSADHPRDARG